MILNNVLDNIKPSAIRVYSNLAKQTPGCIGLTLGEPDFSTPDNICKKAYEAMLNGETHYIANNGDAALLKEICDYESKNNKVKYTPDEVIVTIGATEGLFTALFGILNPGDEVIVPTPAFGLYESIITLCRGEFVPMNIADSDFQIDADKLSNCITEKTKAIILNSPNNPTGCILNEKSLQNVYDAVKGKDIFVICDDVYRNLIYTSEYKSFAEYTDLKNQIIVIQSFSKPYAMTGWRIGYLLAEKSVKEKLQFVHQYSVVSSVSFMQKACIEALNTDIQHMVDVYSKRREYVLKRLDEMNLEYTIPLGGFYVFPSIKRFKLSSDEFCRKMIADVGLAATPGFCFGSDEHIRLTYCYSDEELKEGLDRLERFIKSFDNN